jgi:hypothetical protein
MGHCFLKNKNRKKEKRCKNKQGGFIMGTVKEKLYDRTNGFSY